MLSQLLVLASALVILALGCAHLLITFRGGRLLPREPTLITAMKDGLLRITRETSVWRAWIGFNASHSLGAIFFGLIYGYLALVHPAFLFASIFLQVVGLATLAALLLLAWRYWFSVPFRGIVLAFACYIAGIAAAHA